MKRREGRVGARAALVVIAGAGVAAACHGTSKTQADVDMAREAGVEEGRKAAVARLLDASRVDDKATKATTESEDTGETPYRLNRVTWRITVEPRPIARTRCWLSVGAKADRDERVVEWDPSSSDAPDRFVTLRGEQPPTLRCAFEVVTVGSGQSATSFTYAKKNNSQNAAPGGAHSDGGDAATQNGPSLTAEPVALSGVRPGSGEVTVTTTNEGRVGVPYSARTNPSASQGGHRSLDPLTPFFTELATVIAEVAVDRAKAGAQEVAKERLSRFVCKIGYGAQGSDDAKQIAGGLHSCEDTEVKDGTCSLVFKKTCASLDFLRLEELAASADAIGRALAGDLTEYAFTAIGNTISSRVDDRLVRLTVDSLDKSLQSLIDGNAVRTEREFQTLLLGLAEIPVGGRREKEELVRALETVKGEVVAGTPAYASVDLAIGAATAAGNEPASQEKNHLLARALTKAFEDTASFSRTLKAQAGEELLVKREAARDVLERSAWRCAVGMGAAVLRECLERDVCSADALRTAFERELKDPAPACIAPLALAGAEWPELPGILARAVDVMRPPPGTTPNQTAKAATVIALEILEKRASWYGARREASKADAEHVHAVFDATKALSTALFDRDYAAAAVASARLVSSATAQCGQANESNEKFCNGIDMDQLKRALALLNAFVSYAASYRKEPNGTTDAKSDADRERARRDERKRAMNDLVDAMTDRSGRRDDWILSLGVGVGFSTSRGTQLSALSHVPNLSLPTGPSVDYLWRRSIGLHLQLPFLDLGQFAAVSTDGEVQDKPTFGTAVLFGVQPGVLFFPTTKVPLLLAGDFGYAPGMKLPNQDTAGVVRFGGFLGTYIPFIDFN